MRVWVDRIFLLVITILVAVLAGTALPGQLGGEHLGGLRLLAHMMASGALVFALPLFALYYLGRGISRFKSGGLQRLGFWTLILAGAVTITTMFLCMLPLPSTEQMHQLMLVHGYAGFTMVPALALLLLGAARWRRIQSTRSATPG